MRPLITFAILVLISFSAKSQNVSDRFAKYQHVYVDSYEEETLIQNNHQSSFERNRLNYPVNKKSSIPVMDLQETVTTFGYFYSQKQNDYVRINLKVNIYNHMGNPYLEIVKIRKIGKGYWEDCEKTHVKKVTKQSDGSFANDYEYKATFGRQTVYFNL